MANFFRAVLKHLAAIIVAFVLFCILGVLFLVGISAVFQPKPVLVAENAVLVMDLGIEIYDSPGNTNPLDEMLSSIAGDPVPSVPLRQLLHALEEAKKDENISAILLTGSLPGSGGLANSFATLAELREKLAEVEESGKPVFAYSVIDGLGELYLKSVATEHWMDPFGMLDYRGLSAEVPYIGGTFEKAGVGFQVVRAGQFKSAAEPYTSREMSPETRESLQALLDDLWLSLRKGVAMGTTLPLEELDQLANAQPMMMAEDAHGVGLVDELLPYDELQTRLVQFAGYSAGDKSFVQVGLQDYLRSRRDPLAAIGKGGGNQIAVVYAEGSIVDGEGSAQTVGGDRFARMMRELREDDTVKGIVLRVNSPGGSATASEILAREVRLANEQKPVVVSMGGYAASGGYYISAHAEQIFAQPTTVTGSIGVIAMLPNVQDLAQIVDLQVERVQTNRNGALWSLFSERTEEQLGFFDRYVDQTYALFLEHVSEGRSMTLEAVQRVAEGREWSGTRALEHQLIDGFGGLDVAIRSAADLAGVGDDYRVVDLPRAMKLEEIIAEAITGGGRVQAGTALIFNALQTHAQPVMEEIEWWLQMNDRHHLYSYTPLRVH